LIHSKKTPKSSTTALHEMTKYNTKEHSSASVVQIKEFQNYHIFYIE